MAMRNHRIALAAYALAFCGCERASTMPQDQAGAASVPSGASVRPASPMTGGRLPPSTAVDPTIAGHGAPALSSADSAALPGNAAAAGGSAGSAAVNDRMPEAAGSPAPTDPLAAVVDRTQWQAYPDVTYSPENPYSPEKALLGKALYWDEQLSSDDTVACGTCHRAAAGGSDPRPAASGYIGHPGADKIRGTADDPHGSPGIKSCRETTQGPPLAVHDDVFGDGPRLLIRRAMTSLDAMFSQSMFWDARVGQSFSDPLTGAELIAAGGSLEAQAVLPILNTSEMACEDRTWSNVTSKLIAVKPLALASNLPPDLQGAQARATTYAPMFEAAFGDGAITPARIAMALATYERTLTANQTPWDRWQAGDDSAMTEQEKRGFGVFVVRGLCTCCHTPPLFSGTQLFDDGFHEHSFDGGAAQVGGLPGDYDHPQFRTVSIRNASLREPAGLLHDGLAPGDSLESLVAAYNKEPVRSVSVCRRALGLTAEEQQDLIAFVRNALTDPRAAAEAAPFDRPKLASEP